ncbi:MAG TPA: helix-turn-helix domain-containing protein [Flavobacteriaceae bacterium]|nr:helix-turn-helix domain-containing protein [Flavobacteriaceae bacterium]
MATTIVTPSDLEQLKVELLDGFRELLQKKPGTPDRRWIKNAEVRKMLKISNSTLQTLRINGTLPFTKLGGIIYYDSEEINKLMLANHVHNRQ